MTHFKIYLSLVILLSTKITTEAQTIKFREFPELSKIDVLIDGEIFTSYLYAEYIDKPVLWPVISAKGNKLTRSYPWEEMPGERIDHPHHSGIWLNYGDVNGFDFWNNSNTIPAERKDQYGRIEQQEIKKIYSVKDTAKLVVDSKWISETGIHLLNEETAYAFMAKENYRIIDRSTTLTCTTDSVLFKDDKEGMFAIRVCRELELPQIGIQKLTFGKGQVFEVQIRKNQVPNGNYESSEGISGAEVWGTRARWMKLYGLVNDEKVTMAIIDHPANPGYPTYWHARAYGLFATNPLGQKIFSEGKNELNLTLRKGESVTFKFRFVVFSDEFATNESIDELAIDFEK